jgi:hypothetical protein
MDLVQASWAVKWNLQFIIILLCSIYPSEEEVTEIVNRLHI